METKKWLKQGILRIPTEEAIRAYLAGLIDGEGSIVLIDRTRRGRTFQDRSILITNTSEELMKWLVLTIGSNYRDRTKYKSTIIPHLKPIFEWHCTRTRDIISLLEATLPYLIVKRDKALQVLSFCKSREY